MECVRGMFDSWSTRAQMSMAFLCGSGVALCGVLRWAVQVLRLFMLTTCLVRSICRLLCTFLCHPDKQCCSLLSMAIFSSTPSEAVSCPSTGQVVGCVRQEDAPAMANCPLQAGIAPSSCFSLTGKWQSFVIMQCCGEVLGQHERVVQNG